VAAVTDSHETVGLKANAVNLWGDFVVSIANVAPSSSVAFTLALLVGFTGFSSPLAVLIVGIAMFLVSMGYAALNRWKPSAGAPYVWVGEAINPTVGYGTGFLNSLTSTLANVGNITLAGTYLLFVITPTHTFAKPITWLVATVIIGVLLWLAIRGIRPTVWVQIAFVVIEYTAVIAFVILALIHEASGQGGATLPSLSDFTVARVVGDVGGFKGLAEAAVVCGFLYLGWEAPAVLGEESTKAKVNPGRP
jgi:amino acid transporter